MNTREATLARLRRQLGRTAANAESGREEMERYIAARAPGPRAAPGGDLRRMFCDRLGPLSSSTEDIAELGAAPAAIARYLAAHDLSRQAVCWPAYAALDWAGAGLQVQARPAHGADLVGISGCFCALAETGTLMLCSSEQTPPALSLLPETHIAIVEAQRIVAGMEEAWQLLRSELGQTPRAVNFISGPSRTGDIEQTIVLGAHGPYRVHILIVGSQ